VQRLPPPAVPLTAPPPGWSWRCLASAPPACHRGGGPPARCPHLQGQRNRTAAGPASMLHAASVQQVAAWQDTKSSSMALVAPGGPSAAGGLAVRGAAPGRPTSSRPHSSHSTRATAEQRILAWHTRNDRQKERPGVMSLWRTGEQRASGPAATLQQEGLTSGYIGVQVGGVRCHMSSHCDKSGAQGAPHRSGAHLHGGIRTPLRTTEAVLQRLCCSLQPEPPAEGVRCHHRMQLPCALRHMPDTSSWQWGMSSMKPSARWPAIVASLQHTRNTGTQQIQTGRRWLPDVSNRTQLAARGAHCCCNSGECPLPSRGACSGAGSPSAPCALLLLLPAWATSFRESRQPAAGGGSSPTLGSKLQPANANAASGGAADAAALGARSVARRRGSRHVARCSLRAAAAPQAPTCCADAAAALATCHTGSWRAASFSSPAVGPGQGGQGSVHAGSHVLGLRKAAAVVGDGVQRSNLLLEDGLAGATRRAWIRCDACAQRPEGFAQECSVAEL
jgi:hypothetical protein